ncbi:MAG: sulfotransferase [Phycisphaerae bacterium]|nr:sulfotransferase [Phycisphaerae bacterium]
MRNYLTIVSGLPRSGTSVLMQMIHAGGMPALIDEIRAADEDNPRGYFEFEPVKKTKQDPSWVPRGVGKVVKMVHLLLKDLPAGFVYRVIFARRDLDEVVRSQNIMLERHGKSTAGLPEDRMKQIYLAQIQEVQDFMRARPTQFSWIEVDYNTLVRDPAPIVQRVSAFLDGLDEKGMLTAVDPKLYRNREAKG